MITIPDAFIASAIARDGAAGRAWIESLPTLIETLCQEWNLLVDGDPLHGHLGLVVPVRRAAEHCMLKVSWRDDSTAHEALALAAWNGQGAVRLLAAQPERGAMLLERLNRHRSLQDLPLDEAVAVAGRLLRRLAVPAPDGFPQLHAVAPRIADSFEERWQHVGRPTPRRLLDDVAALARQLAPSAGNLLVNYDLHYGNVLAGEREPWLAIDPKAIAGDPEYGVAQLLWTRLDEMGGRSGFQRHFQALIGHAALDPPRTHSWTLVRIVDYWLWALSIGLAEDPARCEAIVNWLA